MKMTALLSSVPFESDRLRSLLKNVSTVKVASKTAYKGQLAGHNCLLINTGIGKVNAGHTATAVIEKFPIKMIINFGVGGVYPDAGLVPGDIALASREIYGDEGVATSSGIKGMDLIGIPLLRRGRKKYFNEFVLDKKLLSRAARIDRAVGDLKLKTGNFVTLSTTTGTDKRAKELERKHDAICENMEGAAIAHVSTIYQIPTLEVRGISNIAGVRDKRRWKLELSSENCQKAVHEILKIMT